ncbi:unnamed protein product, partial [Ixodes hexagonus]
LTFANISLADIKILMQRWRNLRDTFGRKLRDAKKKSGAEASEPTSKWKHFEQMLFLKGTTSNMDMPHEQDSVESVQEVLLEYEEEEEPEDSASGLLLSMVATSRGSPSPLSTSLPTSSCSTSSSRSMSSQPASAAPSPASNPAPFRSLPSPHSIAASLSQAKSATPSTSRAPHAPKRKRSSTDTLLENIDKQLEHKVTHTEHFLLSLADRVGRVHEHLQGYCRLHLLDVVTQYETGEIPTTLMQVRSPTQH